MLSLQAGNLLVWCLVSSILGSVAMVASPFDTIGANVLLMVMAAAVATITGFIVATCF